MAAKWESKTLGLGGDIQKIARNAQNAINTLDGILSVVKTAGDVAKQFLLLSNPLGAIIRLTADEIIRLANDFKEVGAFYIVIDPFDETYGNRPQLDTGLALEQDENGLYIIQNMAPLTDAQKRAIPYLKTLNLDDLSIRYKDINGKSKDDEDFIPPFPKVIDPPQFVAGGFDPATWNGTLQRPEVTSTGLIPPKMTPSEVLTLMSEAFDDEGDVSRFKVTGSRKIENAKKGPFTASGTQVEDFNPRALQNQPLYNSANTALPLDQRGEITTRISSGRPNFAGSSNINGVELVAIVGVVGVSDFTKFANVMDTFNNFFQGAPGLEEIKKSIDAFLESPGLKLSITNNTQWGTFEKDEYIIGESSGAVGKIISIDSTTNSVRISRKPTVTKDELGQVTAVTEEIIDHNEGNTWKDMEIQYQQVGSKDKKFIPGEIIREALLYATYDSGGVVDTVPRYRAFKSAAIDDPNIGYVDLQVGDLAKYGQVRGIDTSVPDSVLPNFESVKIKDFFPGYSEFFDQIIQFAEGIKGYADGFDNIILKFIKLIDDYIEYFSELRDKIVGFLEFFTKGLPEAGVYWLTIKTRGGSKAIQDALLNSENQPPDVLKFSAGIMLVSVSGVGGLSATKGLETIFTGLGLNFQEVAAPTGTEILTAVKSLQDEYREVIAARDELVSDIKDLTTPEERFQDALVINLNNWNGVEPSIGDYILGSESGCIAQIIDVSIKLGKTLSIVVDHVKLGPTIITSQGDEDRILELEDSEGENISFPFKLELLENLVPPNLDLGQVDFNAEEGVNLVEEGRYTHTVVQSRSSHNPSGPGTTIYEAFQGNEGSFPIREDVTEEISRERIRISGDVFWNPTSDDLTISLVRSKIVVGSSFEPELPIGFDGGFGSFSLEDQIISFDSTSAKIFLDDIRGENANDDGTRRVTPPILTDKNTHKMSASVDGEAPVSFIVKGSGGNVATYDAAFDNILNPLNLEKGKKGEITGQLF